MSAGKIAQAMIELVRAVPGCGSINASVGEHWKAVAFNCDTDDHAHALAAHFGINLEFTQNTENRWLRGSGRVDGMGISVFGPMHAIIDCAPDETKVAAALAQADAAVQP